MEPVVGSDALRRGVLTRRGLARDFARIHRDVYLPRGTVLTARLRAEAAWLATGSPVCGVSAAAVAGARWLDPAAPAEIVRPDRHAPPGIVVHTWAVRPDELGLIAGVDTTTPARTAFDLGRTRPVAQAVPLLDALLRATRVSVADVLDVTAAHPGAPGVARLRRTLELVDGGAESPQESRLRLLLVGAGLPRPTTQIEFRELRIRVDLGWPRWRVAVEYDGVHHWSDHRQRAWDIDRLALLEEAGWVVVRVSSAMMARPDVVIARVRAKLSAAGCPM